MNSYPEYKDSGFEWLGEIPTYWKLSRIGNFFQERSVKVDDTSFPPLSVTMNGIVDQLSDVAKTNDNDNRKLVRKDDFVINSRSDRKGSSGISPRDGSVSLINIVLAPSNIEPSYIEHLFKGYYFKEEYFRNGKGIHWDLWTTRWDQLKNINIPVPPIETQILISKFLDKKTSQIDSLIEKTERKILLLKEERTALINQCVTKGLDPNVKMKDSGIEWIGEIPKHWLVIPNGGLFKEKSIKNTEGEKNLSVYRDYGVILTDSRDDNHNRISEDTSGYKLVEVGDFVLNKMKCWMGSLGVSEYRGIVSPSYTVCEPTKEIHRKYFHHLLRSQTYIQIYKSFSYGVRIGQWELRFHDFKTIKSLYPPIQEQILISKFLDKKTSQIDSLIEKEIHRINLLKEYRQSLISNVVTGKVRVTEDMI